MKLQRLSECVTDNAETILPHFTTVKSAMYINFYVIIITHDYPDSFDVYGT